MEATKRRKLSLKIKRDSNNVVPKASTSQISDAQKKYSQAGGRTSVERKQKMMTEDSEVYEKREKKEASTLTELQVSLLRLERRFAKDYSPWDLPPFPPPPDPYNGEIQQVFETTNLTSDVQTFPAQCMKCLQIQSAAIREEKAREEPEKAREEPQRNHQSVQESLKQLFSVESLSETLPSSQPEEQSMTDSFNNNNSEVLLDAIINRPDAPNNDELKTKDTERRGMQYGNTKIKTRQKRYINSLNNNDELKTEDTVTEGRGMQYGNTKINQKRYINSSKSESEVAFVKTQQVGNILDKTFTPPSSSNVVPSDAFPIPSVISKPGCSVESKASECHITDTLAHCPLCQLSFSVGTSEFEKDSHIAQCLSTAGDEVIW